MSDVKLVEDASGAWDIDFNEEGDFLMTDTTETALLLSVLGEARADSSQVARPELRRGWIGNELADVEGFEQGSLLWLFYQSRSPNEADIAAAVGYLQDGLAWMIEDGLLQNVTASGSSESGKMRVRVNLIRINGGTETRYFDLWERTQNASRIPG